MANITNAQAVRYSNEIVRPMAERFRALKAAVDSALATWNGGVGDLFPVDAEALLEDGREAEGVSRLSGNDVVLLITQLQAFQTQMNGVGVASVISKPCVRDIGV